MLRVWGTPSQEVKPVHRCLLQVFIFSTGCSSGETQEDRKVRSPRAANTAKGREAEQRSPNTGLGWDCRFSGDVTVTQS